MLDLDLREARDIGSPLGQAGLRVADGGKSKRLDRTASCNPGGRCGIPEPPGKVIDRSLSRVGQKAALSTWDRLVAEERAAYANLCGLSAWGRFVAQLTPTRGRVSRVDDPDTISGGRADEPNPRRHRPAVWAAGLVVAGGTIASFVVLTTTPRARPPHPPGPALASSTPLAVSNDFAGSYYQHCHVHLLDSALAEPFWLGGDHFDPPGNRRSAHTASEVMQAYRTNPMSRTMPGQHLRVAFAAFSQTDVAVRPVWIVVINRISDTGPSSTPLINYVSIFDDRDHLRYLGTLVDNLPGQCR